MTAQPLSLPGTEDQQAAVRALVASAATNIPGVDLASISVRRSDQTLHTVAATDQLAHQADAIQYELREGPCYDAVTDERFVLVNDLTSAGPYPRYGPRAANLGIFAQAASQLEHNGERAGLNLYALRPQAFDRTTVQMTELFSTQAAALLGYARQVETLGEAAHARQDIGTAVGIIMERYGIDRSRAFGYLVRHSNNSNIKLRTIAQQVIEGTFQLGTADDLGVSRDVSRART